MHGSGQRTTGAPPTRRARGSRLGRAVVGLGLLAWLPAPLVAAAPPPASGRSAGIQRSPAFEAVHALLDANRYEAADSLARAELARVEQEDGPESLEAARALDLVVAVLGRRGGDASKEAEGALVRALSIRERLLDAEDPELAASLSGLGDFYARAQDYDRARPLLEKALALQEKNLPPDSPRLAASLGRMGNFLLGSGDYVNAESTFRRQRSILERAPTPDFRALAQNAYNMACAERELARYTEAEASYRESIRLTGAGFGPKSALIAWPMNGLATLHENVGEYAEARRLYEQTLALADSTLEPNNPFIASCLNNLAYVLVRLGEYPEARGILERALTLARNAPAPDEASIAGILGNLAGIRLETGKIPEAISLQTEALALRERVLGPDHPFVASDLRGRGTAFLRDGKPVEAERDFRRALKILGTPPNRTSPDDVVTATKGLGDALVAQGRFTAAKDAYEEALQEAESKLGPSHPLVAEVCSAISALDDARGNREAALAMALRAESISREHLRLTAAALPEREALAYARVARRGLDQALALVSDRLSTGPRETIWDALVRDRATVLDVMAARHRTLATSGDPAIAGKLQELSDASRALAHLLVSGPDLGGSGTYAAELESSTRRREAAERALAEVDPRLRNGRVGAEAGLAEVRDHVPAGTALLSYARFQRGESTSGTDASGSPHDSAYLAFILSPRTGTAEAIPLGPAAEVDSLVAAWTRLAGRPPDQDHTQETLRGIGSRLRAVVWDPVVPHLQGADRILVVPDGSLALVNFDALPAGASGYLAETAPVLQYLSAERDLVAGSHKPRTGSDLLVMGAPDFDAESAGPVSEPLAAGEATDPGESRLRGHGGALPTLDGVRFPPLPGTADEVREIAEVWRDARRQGANGGEHEAHAGRARVLTGSAATEAAFKLEAPGVRVIHLATHGFFLDGSDAPRVLGSRGIGGLNPRREERGPVDNPLLLAGLALAGANHRDAATPGSEDGILTAEEIAAMNLTGVDWVVLSACETGVGRIRTGEGVMGLRRAFQIAGARTLVMSLWAVGDEAARDWMTAFYRARIVEGEDAAASARAATLTALAHVRTKTGGDDPFYWGGFVAVGAGQ